MNNILFHPQISASEAASIAVEQGGRLVWRSDRKHLELAKQHTDRSAAAIEAEDYNTALIHLRAAHETLFGGAPCLS